MILRPDARACRTRSVISTVAEGCSEAIRADGLGRLETPVMPGIVLEVMLEMA